MKKTLIFLTICFALLFSNTVQAKSEETFYGTVTGKNETTLPEQNYNPDIELVEVSLNENQQIIKAYVDKKMAIQSNDKVVLTKSIDSSGNSQYFISDHVRTPNLLALFLIFIFVVLIISKKSGLLSLLGMAYSFFIIFSFLLPQINSGNSPILITFITVALIAPVTFFLSHGFNQKSLAALVATLASLGITSLIATLFINKAHLTGFGSEEAYFLQITRDMINIKGLFLAGIIVGTLGILDDATVTQASIVAQLKSTNRHQSVEEIYEKAMQVGHDHIASTVNTLILVYTGASLPLFLLFINSQKHFSEVLNNQIIAEEIVTMLVSSIGLILSIPVATIVASYFITSELENNSEHIH